MCFSRLQRRAKTPSKKERKTLTEWRPGHSCWEPHVAGPASALTELTAKWRTEGSHETTTAGSASAQGGEEAEQVRSPGKASWRG